MGTTPPITTNNPQNTRPTKPHQAKNADKVPGVDRTPMGNLIEFTKDTENGCYGYLKDVIDVAEEEDYEW